MARQMIIREPSRIRHLTESLGENEAELQCVMRYNHNLLPFEDLGITEKVVALGREVWVSAGAIDLLLLTDVGELVLAEFKTGPQNPDFRRVLAQLLDYGSALHGMTLEEFDQRIAKVLQRPTKTDDDALAACLAGVKSPLVATDGNRLTSLADAFPPEDGDAGFPWQETLARQLIEGAFHYVVVAQRFTPQMLKTLGYLNDVTTGCRFSAVELVKFVGQDGLTAYEGRVHATGQKSSSAATKSANLSGVDEFVERLADEDIRKAVSEFLRQVSGIPGMRLFWGVKGCSFRATVPGRSPISIGWLFPPGEPGFMGLTDLTLGWYKEKNGLAVSPTVANALAEYAAKAHQLTGAVQPSAGPLNGATIPLSQLSDQLQDCSVLLAETAAVLTQAPPGEQPEVGPEETHPESRSTPVSTSQDGAAPPAPL